MIIDTPYGNVLINTKHIVCVELYHCETTLRTLEQGWYVYITLDILVEEGVKVVNRVLNYNGPFKDKELAFECLKSLKERINK
jgi:hypothetical protein